LYKAYKIEPRVDSELEKSQEAEKFVLEDSELPGNNQEHTPL